MKNTGVRRNGEPSDDRRCTNFRPTSPCTRDDTSVNQNVRLTSRYCMRSAVFRAPRPYSRFVFCNSSRVTPSVRAVPVLRPINLCARNMCFFLSVREQPCAMPATRYMSHYIYRTARTTFTPGGAGRQNQQPGEDLSSAAGTALILTELPVDDISKTACRAQTGNGIRIPKPSIFNTSGRLTTKAS